MVTIKLHIVISKHLRGWMDCSNKKNLRGWMVYQQKSNENILTLNLIQDHSKILTMSRVLSDKQSCWRIQSYVASQLTKYMTSKFHNSMKVFLYFLPTSL